VEVLAVVTRKNGELADLAETAAEAERLLGNAKRALRTARKKAAELVAAGGKKTRPRVGGGAGWHGR
jgi:IS5 family transposase